MDSSSSKKQKGDQDLIATEQEMDAGSLGLHALGELHAHEQRAAPGQKAEAAEAHAPVAADGSSPATANDGEPKADLQAALDWYKDWLSSME